VVDDGSTGRTAAAVERYLTPADPAGQAGQRGQAGGAEHRGSGRARGRAIGVWSWWTGDTGLRSRTRFYPAGPAVRRTPGSARSSGKRQRSANRKGAASARWQAHRISWSDSNLDRRDVRPGRLPCPTVPGAIGGVSAARRWPTSAGSATTRWPRTPTLTNGDRAGRVGAVVYEEKGPIAWTEAPTASGSLWSSATAWSYGTMQAM